MYTTMTDYMHATVGPKWVIARRSPRIVARYGEDVVCLSPARYATLRALFDAQVPDPARDAARAMLAALKLMQAALTEYGLRDVKKRYSLCVADAAASNAIAAAEAAGMTS